MHRWFYVQEPTDSTLINICTGLRRATSALRSLPEYQVKYGGRETTGKFVSPSHTESLGGEACKGGGIGKRQVSEAFSRSRNLN